MSHTPTPDIAGAPPSPRLRAIRLYLLGLVVLGLLFCALGLPQPWLLAAQWASALVLILMALALGMGLLAIAFR